MGWVSSLDDPLEDTLADTLGGHPWSDTLGGHPGGPLWRTPGRHPWRTLLEDT
jgi:hypothetical protein